MFVSKIVQSIAVHKYLHKRILLLLYCCTTTINQRNIFVYQKYFISGKIYLGFRMIIKYDLCFSLLRKNNHDV